MSTRYDVYKQRLLASEPLLAYEALFMATMSTDCTWSSKASSFSSTSSSDTFSSSTMHCISRSISINHMIHGMDGRTAGGATHLDDELLDAESDVHNLHPY